jgi:hypothetical protein
MARQDGLKRSAEMKNYTTSAVCVVFAAVFAFYASRGRLVKFGYARMVDNEALTHPIKVNRVDGPQITLADGRTIQLEERLDRYWSDSLKAGSTVEVDTSSGDDYFAIYGNEPRSICGGTYAFTIPLFPHDVNANRRSLLGFGSFSKKPSEEAEPVTAPNGP